jgi:hypothetical protein
MVSRTAESSASAGGSLTESIVLRFQISTCASPLGPWTSQENGETHNRGRVDAGRRDHLHCDDESGREAAYKPNILTSHEGNLGVLQSQTPRIDWTLIKVVMVW